MRRIEKITGRSDDMIILRGVNLFPTQIEELVLALPALSPHFQCRLEREGTLDSMTVLVERRDVPVAHERDLGVGVGDQLGGGVVTQAGQPLELVRVVRVGQFTAVGHVEAVDADAVANRGDRARLRVLGLLGVLVEAGHAVEAEPHVLEPDAGGHGDAVPLAQAVVGDLVAQFAEVLLGDFQAVLDAPNALRDF